MTHEHPGDEHHDHEHGSQPSEEELRAAYEAELSRITSDEVMLQAAVSLLNVGGRRLGAVGPPPDGHDVAGGVGRDLEQVRDAIDAVRALLGILERRLPKELGPLRDALSQLQIAYARQAQASAGTGAPAGSQSGAQSAGAVAGRPGATHPAEGTESPAPGDRDRPGPAEASGRLWVPGR